MKRFFIYSFFIMFFPIYSSEKNKGWTQISWMGWGLGTIQKTRNFSELEKEKIHKELRMNSFLFHVGINQSLETSSLKIQLEADLGASNESKTSFFAGKNLFLELKKDNVFLIFGRVREEFKTSSFTDWLDGTDGISIKADLGKSGRVRFDLFDFYSGYSIFDKNGLKNEILNTKKPLGEIDTNNSALNTFKNRYRGGVSYRYDLTFLETGFRFSYNFV